MGGNKKNIKSELILWTVIINIYIFHICECGNVKNITKFPIKIVNELPRSDPLDMGIEASNDLIEGGNQENERKLILKPVPFSGPEQFEKLKGACFTFIDDKYKYKFCPFSNITQEELIPSDNMHRVILGVWGEWIIQNNTFTSMHFLKGTKCGSGLERNTKVGLRCGENYNLIKVGEPEKCKYEGFFESPLACGLNALVVYPRLERNLQLEWDRIETEKHYEILTPKGYEEGLKRLFLTAGFLVSPERKESLNSEVLNNDCKCEDETEALKKRIEELEVSLKGKDDEIMKLNEQIRN